MKVYSGAGLGDVYFQLVRDITEHGRKIVVRGLTCLEMTEPICLEYHRPGYCWMRIPGRKFNPFFALAEVMWILSGNGNVEWISYFNSNMRSYADEGKEDFHGSYGLRLREWPSHIANYISLDQIEWVVRKLQRDSFSRQAVISLWDPERDNIIPSKDYPCNNVVYYSLRDEVLEQTVVIRSNDLIWGTPVNAIQFTHLQALVAGMLGVRMGKLTYVIQNLHYYLDLYKPILSNVLEQAYEKRIQAESIPSFDTVGEKQFEDAMIRVDSLTRPFLTSSKLRKCFPFPNSMRPGVGYWSHVIPTVINLFMAVKDPVPFSEGKAKFHAYEVSGLGQPLFDLIVDFYRDSKNSNAQQLLELLQVNKEA